VRSYNLTDHVVALGVRLSYYVMIEVRKAEPLPFPISSAGTLSTAG
jgi:hypothetical protein